MALVLAAVAIDAGHAASMWCPLPGQAPQLARERSSARLPELRLPDALRVTDDAAAAFADATLMVSAIPAQFARATWTRLAAHVPAGAGVVTVTKGVEVGSMQRPTQVLRDVLGARPLVVLSGPTIAHELALHKPAVMVAAGSDDAFARRVQSTFSQPWLRIYTSDDPTGVELAGAAKNVIALAAGMVDGLSLGSNAKSALLARGLAEIVRLGLAMGSRTETFFGVAGVGDLATTCFSPEGRNRTLGEAIGRGASLADALHATQSVVEGVETCKSLRSLAEKYNVEMPIAAAVYRVLFENLPPTQAIRDLMSRSVKVERIG
ncbi:MAG: NAD(P)-dependent glycerol-3-phosphate dehydrogenase [Planctomycetes bacterium]|nr:NAD(P)-dependent glycerol-3-phosphate dehydrogenase [Planctomycetota bacterium]